MGMGTMFVSQNKISSRNLARALRHRRNPFRNLHSLLFNRWYNNLFSLSKK